MISQTLLDLVSTYSPSGQEQAAVEGLVGRMLALGFDQTWMDAAGNAVGILGGAAGNPDGLRQIVLLGHIDTVTGEIAVREEDGQLYGRGTVDAKGPLAAFVDAAARCGRIPGWQIVVAGAVDEERDSVGARYLVSRLKPDFAIIGEPSQWDRVTLGYKGSAWTEITVRRERAHTASQNESASEAAVKTWLAIQAGVEDLNEGKQRAFDRVLLTLRGLSSAQDGFNEWASLQVGVRLPPGISPEDWYAWLAQACPGVQIRPSGFPMPAYQGEKNNPLVRAFLAGIRQVGGKPGFVVKTGSADINIAAPAWGCPAVAYGPGDSALDHTPNEHLDLEEYERAVEVLVQVLWTLTQ